MGGLYAEPSGADTLKPGSHTLLLAPDQGTYTGATDDAVNVVARSASGTVGNVYSVPVADPSSCAPPLPGKRRSYESAVANC